MYYFTFFEIRAQFFKAGRFLPWTRLDIMSLYLIHTVFHTAGVYCNQYLWNRTNAPSVYLKMSSPGGYLTKFCTGRLRPEVQHLTLSYTILAEKVPLSHTYFGKSCSSFHVVLNK